MERISKDQFTSKNYSLMRKIAVVSFNSNPDYSYYAPLCAWAWRKIGWEVMALYQPAEFVDPQKEQEILNLIRKTSDWRDGNVHHSVTMPRVESIAGYRSDTVTQISRLYGAYAQGGPHGPDDYLMTIDIDMIPLSDYWEFDPEEITIWGFDLTGYTEVPICYIGMKSTRWIEVMGLNIDDPKCIERDLNSMPQAKETAPWEKRWSVDQQLITKRLNETQFKKTFITRGQLPNGYARGRVDRGSWSMDHPEFIDAHLLRDIYKNQDNMRKTLDLLHTIWPKEDFLWFVNYTKEFAKLTKQIYG